MKILVIRRDNIGDLVCTTPLIRALRQQLPDARIEALVTHYNAEVLAGNPDLDQVHSYQKAKHRSEGEGRFGIYWDRLKTILALRRTNFDWVLLPGGAQASSQRFARMIAPKCVLVRDDQDKVAGSHEVEQCCHLLSRMGLNYETPAVCVRPNPVLQASYVEQVTRQLGLRPKRLIGVHISARKPSQRWALERFVALIQALTEDAECACLLFWAPGKASDPKHPGDDEKASEILDRLQGRPVLPMSTQGLDKLIAAISVCDTFICADGGAMHLAAALGKPMLCMFGDSDPERWGPWSSRYRVLQPQSRDVKDLSVQEVLTAWQGLSCRDASLAESTHEASRKSR